ncbi:MAG TPA: choice-of-anchor Q domain-containing protein, partial [Chloroflexota bacterium]|nr:choice-of-anchor Q domain-containing protein [Chloroflexota bacterium]
MIFHQMRGLKKQSTTGRTRHRRRLGMLEGLEGRVLLTGSPTIYTVDPTSDTGAGSNNKGDLLYCITQANADPNTAGSEITFDPTVFNAATPQTIKLSKTLDLTETAGPEMIDGPGAGVVTISGNNAVEVFDDPQANVTASLSGLTISGGMTNASGGGINNDGTVTVTNCTIVNNSAAFGAGIYNDGILMVTGSMVESNSASQFAGGIDNADGGTLTLTSTTVAKNTAVDSGGGILNGGASTVTLTDGVLSDNSAVSGGGIDNNSSNLTVTGSTLSGNKSTGTAANDGGGGVYNSGGTASITGSTLSGNSAVAGGGGIYEGGGALTIAGSTLSDNSATGSSAPGGGIDENSGTLTITNSTVAGNSAQGFGAGIQENTGALTAVNCTIAYNYEDSITEIAFGGGMNVTAGPVTLDNTIIALNTDGPSLGGPADNLFSEGNPVSSASADNLIGTGGGYILTNGSNGNQVGVANPGLGALASNGGPTETIALLAGSPAIDAGSNSLAVDPQGKALTTDQRGLGFPRI